MLAAHIFAASIDKGLNVSGLVAEVSNLLIGMDVLIELEATMHYHFMKKIRR